MNARSLTSRERVLRTLNHKEPDRVPFNLNLTVDIYHGLRKHLKLPPEPDKVMDLGTAVSASLDLVEAMQVDFYYLKLGAPVNWKPPIRLDGVIVDEWGVGYRKTLRPGGFYYEMVEHPLAGASLKDIEAYCWPDPGDLGRTATLRDKVAFIRKETDKAIMAKFTTPVWEQAWYLCGLQQWMMDLIENPKRACAILDQVCRVAMGLAKAGLETVGEQIDILRLSGDDLGTQTSPMISLQMYEKFVKPRFERLWNYAKGKLIQKNPAGKLMLHSCGDVRPFIPSWIEIGLDVLDPIQPRAVGMEPAGLKQDFGKQLVFHGGIDLQQVLPFGTPEEVMAEVKRYIQILSPGGGYIVAPAHNVQNDVPPDNLIAMRDAVLEYGVYPIERNVTR
jgi:uroporphyrinogen decarboxylase